MVILDSCEILWKIRAEIELKSVIIYFEMKTLDIKKHEVRLKNTEINARLYNYTSDWSDLLGFSFI